MEFTFLYEDALKKKAIDENSLPQPIAGKISQIKEQCRKLADIPEADTEAQEKLNAEIDKLDEAVAKEIMAIGVEPAPAPAPAPAPTPTPEPTPTPAPEEEQNNAGKIVLGLAIVGGLIWGAMKVFGGKK